MLRFKSSYRAVLSLHHGVTGMPDQENHSPVFDWSIELFVFLIGIPLKMRNQVVNFMV
jgi:hypothetical protein